jgi:Cys-rich protein (TIGR01571 family)
VNVSAHLFALNVISMYELYRRLGEGFCNCFCGGILPLRTKIRSERGIEGSIFGNICATIWCPCCSLFQMVMELKTTNSSV